jgi:NUMOD4 motif-containing protein/HNH endonuclease
MSAEVAAKFKKVSERECSMSRDQREHWRIVPSEPHYEVSDLGCVRSLDFQITCIGRGGNPYTRWHRGRLLKPVLQTNGYFDVTVQSDRYINSKRVPRRRSVASMVLEAFVGPRPDGQHSRHLDDDRANNKLQNLAWGTPTDNGQDKKRNGGAWKPKGELHPSAKLTDDQVRQIRRAYKRYGREHILLAKKFGISGMNARRIGKRKGWTHVAD